MLLLNRPFERRSLVLVVCPLDRSHWPVSLSAGRSIEPHELRRRSMVFFGDDLSPGVVREQQSAGVHREDVQQRPALQAALSATCGTGAQATVYKKPQQSPRRGRSRVERDRSAFRTSTDLGCRSTRVQEWQGEDEGNSDGADQYAGAKPGWGGPLANVGR